MSRPIHLRPDRGEPTSVIVPIAERDGPLGEVYREYAPVLEARGGDFEFIFVTQSGHEETLATLQPLIDAGEPIRIVLLEHAASEATLIQAGATHAAHPVLAVLPPYRRVTAEGFARLLATLGDEGVDFVTARRFPRRDPLWIRIQSRVLHALLRHTVWVRFRDIGSGVRVLRREVLDDVPLHAEYARFLPVLAVRAGYRVREVDVPQHADDLMPRFHPPGTYLRRFIDLIGLAFLVRFTRKPLRFFGFIGTGLASIGAATLVILAVQRVAGRPLADRPLLLLAVLLVVLGTQSIGLGLIGELVVHFQAARTRGYRLAPDSPGSERAAPTDETGTSGHRAS